MKKNLLCLTFAIVILLFATACNTSTDDMASDAQSSPKEDVATQWSEPALEALVREKLGKPIGDIMLSELDHIWGIELFGDTHIYFNADGGFQMYKSVDGYLYIDTIINPGNILLSHQEGDSMDFLKDGVYSVENEQYTRGSIAALKDFANFRNLRFLHIYKNRLDDLYGLSHLENLTELKLLDDAISDITALAELLQIDSLNLFCNQVEDISVLGKLSQLSQLRLGNNQISNAKGLAPLHDLAMLNLSYNPITSIEVIKEMEQLKRLWFDKTEVDDISPLIGKLSISSLTMNYLQVEAIDLAPLSTLEKIRGLSIKQDKAELLNFQVLGELKNLWFLDIRPNINIPEDYLDWLNGELPECQIE